MKRTTSISSKRAIDIVKGDRIKVPASDGGLGIVEQSGPAREGMRRIYVLCPNSPTRGAQVILIAQPDSLIELAPCTSSSSGRLPSSLSGTPKLIDPSSHESHH